MGLHASTFPQPRAAIAATAQCQPSRRGPPIMLPSPSPAQPTISLQCRRKAALSYIAFRVIPNAEPSGQRQCVVKVLWRMIIQQFAVLISLQVGSSYTVTAAKIL
jgi:hypothetical protein